MTPKEIIIAAAPVADEILEICEHEPISVILMALMLSQIQVAKHARITKEELHKLFEELWAAHQFYEKMRREAH